MNRHDKIGKDHRIMQPLAELLKKIQEILGPSPKPTDDFHSTTAKDIPSSETQDEA